jgi:hypothetical protein
MATDLQKLAGALKKIEKRFPAGGKRYDRIVEDPFTSGVWPLRNPTKKDAAGVRRVLRRRARAKPAGR